MHSDVHYFFVSKIKFDFITVEYVIIPHLNLMQETSMNNAQTQEQLNEINNILEGTDSVPHYIKIQIEQIKEQEKEQSIQEPVWSM